MNNISFSRLISAFLSRFRTDASFLLLLVITQPVFAASISDLQTPCMEYHLTRDARNEGFVSSQDADAMFSRLELTTMGTTKAGSAYGSGKLIRIRQLVRNTTTITWCLIPHPDKPDTYVLSVSPKPYNAEGEIKRYLINDNANLIGYIGEKSAVHSFSLSQERAAKKSDIIARRKHLMAEGAFRLFGHEEKNIHQILKITHQQEREDTSKSPFPVHYTYRKCSRNIKISDFKFRMIESEYGLRTYSFIITYDNSSPQDETASTTLILKDPDGFEVSSTYAGRVTLPGKEKTTQTSTWLIDRKFIKPGNTIEIIVER